MSSGKMAPFILCKISCSKVYIIWYRYSVFKYVFFFHFVLNMYVFKVSISQIVCHGTAFYFSIQINSLFLITVIRLHKCYYQLHKCNYQLCSKLHLLHKCNYNWIFLFVFNFVHLSFFFFFFQPFNYVNYWNASALFPH